MCRTPSNIFHRSNIVSNPETTNFLKHDFFNLWFRDRFFLIPYGCPAVKAHPQIQGPARYRLGLSLAICGPVLFEVALRVIFKQPVHEQTAFKSLQGVARGGASKESIYE